jgi:hypothetical protein
MGQRGAAHARARYQLSRMTSSTLAVYDEVVAAKRRVKN